MYCDGRSKIGFQDFVSTNCIFDIESGKLLWVATASSDISTPYKLKYQLNSFNDSSCAVKNNILIELDSFTNAIGIQLNRTSCMILSQRECISTNDGFRSWSTSTNDSLYGFYWGYDVRDSTILVSLNYSNAYLCSTNSGKEWHRLTTPRMGSTAHVVLNRFRIVEPNVYFCVSSHSDREAGTKLYKSQDGGGSWTEMVDCFPTSNNDSTDLYNVNAITFTSAGIGIMEVSHTVNGISFHEILRSTDKGKTWLLIRSSEYNVGDVRSPGIHLKCVSADTLLLFCIKGQVMISKDAGLSWSWLVREDLSKYDDGRPLPIQVVSNPLVISSTEVYASFDWRQDDSLNIMKLVPETVNEVEDKIDTETNRIEYNDMWFGEAIPSPAYEELRLGVSLLKSVPFESTRYALYDFYGTRIQSGTLGQLEVRGHRYGMSWSTYVLNLSQYPEGIYFVQVGDQTYTDCKAIMHLRR